MTTLRYSISKVLLGKKIFSRFLCSALMMFRYYSTPCSYLLRVPVVEPLSSWHAVQLALSRRPQVGDPLIQLPLKPHRVEAGTLLLPGVSGRVVGRALLQVARNEALGRPDARRGVCVFAGSDSQIKKKLI
jgi:hypothetical protein